MEWAQSSYRLKKASKTIDFKGFLSVCTFKFLLIVQTESKQGF